MPDPEQPIRGGEVLRTRLAAERTLLSWIRTGLSLMGFGFVVARFGLFLREVEFAARGTMHTPTGFSRWLGTALVVLGVIVSALAAVHHVRFIKRIEQGTPITFTRWSLGVIVATLLAALGIAITIYLITVSR